MHRVLIVIERPLVTTPPMLRTCGDAWPPETRWRRTGSRFPGMNHSRNIWPYSNHQGCRAASSAGLTTDPGGLE